MNKSKQIIISEGKINPASVGHSGIDITYIKSRKVLYISAWYDSFVGIEGVEIPLDQFYELLGIKKRVEQ